MGEANNEAFRLPLQTIVKQIQAWFNKIDSLDISKGLQQNNKGQRLQGILNPIDDRKSMKS